VTTVTRQKLRGTAQTRAVPRNLSWPCGRLSGSVRALAAFGPPVLVLAGGVDLQWPPQVLTEFAALFPAARFHRPAGRWPLSLAR